MSKSANRVSIALTLALVSFVHVAVGGATSCTGMAQTQGDARSAKRAREQVRVLSAVGMRQVLLDLGPQFERDTGCTLTIALDSAGNILERINGGEIVDLVVMPRGGLDRLVQGGHVAADSVRDLAASHVGVAVRKGAPRPNISTPEAFRRAMREARSIACPDPARGGSSGLHIAKIFAELGIAQQVRHKLVYASTPSDADAMPANLVATGRAEIALHQMQELMAVPGVEIVGPFPGTLEGTFVFSAGVHTKARDREAVAALIAYLGGRHARDAIKAKGMDPIVP